MADRRVPCGEPARLLLVSEYFHPHWTGLSRAFFETARLLVRRGHAVQVLTVRYSEALAADEEIDGVRIHRSPYAFGISRTQYSPQMVLDLIRRLPPCDTVMVNSPCSNILFVALAARLAGKRLIVFHQGDLILSRHAASAVGSAAIERLFDVFTWGAMALAHRVTTYTDDYARHSRVMRPFVAKCTPFIPPIRVPCGEGACAGTTRPVLARMKEEGARLVGFAGRFVEEKGFDLLLRAAPIVRAEVPEARFVFAGEINVHYEQCFERHRAAIAALGDGVVLLGLLQDGALRAFYESLDLFVLSSRSECFGLTQVEAALLGVPLVVADIPGARTLVKETGCGRLVPPENPAALAAAIVALLRDGAAERARCAVVPRFLETYGTPPID